MSSRTKLMILAFGLACLVVGVACVDAVNDADWNQAQSAETAGSAFCSTVCVACMVNDAMNAELSAVSESNQSEFGQVTNALAMPTISCREVWKSCLSNAGYSDPYNAPWYARTRCHARTACVFASGGCMLP